MRRKQRRRYGKDMTDERKGKRWGEKSKVRRNQRRRYRRDMMDERKGKRWGKREEKGGKKAAKKT